MDISQKEREIRNLIHHELKTPLVPILGYCEMLLNPKFGSINSDQKEAIEDIHSNVTQLKDLLTEILKQEKQ